MTDWADEIAEQLLDFWTYQAEQGLARDMQGNIAAALRDAQAAEHNRLAKLMDQFSPGAVAAQICDRERPQNSPTATDDKQVK